MNHRNLIKTLLAEITATHDRKDAALLELHTLYQATVVQLADAKKPRRKNRTFEGSRKVVAEEASDLLDSLRPKSDQIVDDTFARLERLRALIGRASNMCRPESGSRALVLDSISSTSYGSQGWGAERYARAAADRMAAKSERHGIASQVVPDQRQNYTNYQVVCQVADPVDLEIIKNKSENLIEVVKSYWKQGVNPRVYLPGLPVGFEQKVGLDFFGGNLAN